MVNFTATKTVATYETAELAAAALETALEVTVNTSVVRTCMVVPIEGNRHAAILIVTAAVT